MSSGRQISRPSRTRPSLGRNDRYQRIQQTTEEKEIDPEKTIVTPTRPKRENLAMKASRERAERSQEHAKEHDEEQPEENENRVAASSGRRTTRERTRVEVTPRGKLDIQPLVMEYVPPLKQIELMKSQPEHVEELKAVYAKSPIAISISEPGTGKSWIAGYICQRFKFNAMLVFGPVAAEHTWKEVFELHGINGQFISYDTLRGVGDSPLKHPYLVRVQGKNRKDTKYLATDIFREIITKKLFLVVDEAHEITGDSLRTAAVTTLTSTLINTVYDKQTFPDRKDRESRIILLTATHFEKHEEVLNVLRTMGILTEEKLFRRNPITKEKQFTGINEIAIMASKIDPETTAELLNEYPAIYIDTETSVLLAYELYSKIIAPAITSSMTKEEDTEFQHIVVNKYFDLYGADKRNYISAINALATATKFKIIVDDEGVEHYEIDYRGKQDEGQSKLGAITIALEAIERAKVNAIVRDVKRVLDKNRYNKGLILQYNIGNINTLAEELKEYAPLILVGATPKQKRWDMIDKYQTNDRYRLIIAQIKVGGQSLSLHDKQGGRRRYVWVTPRYSVKTAFQAAGRANRYGGKSDSMVMFVYGKSSESETKILTALARKSKVLRTTYEESKRGKILLPDEYEQVNEGDEDEYEI